MAGYDLKARPLPSQHYLKELFDYEPETGVLTWKVSRSNRVKVGSEAGNSKSSSYRQVRFDGSDYLVHRLIWRWMTGDDPGDMEIDHIDRNPSNNSWSNLRIADRVSNGSNLPKKKSNTSGVAGVCWDKRWETYQAQIRINKRRYYKNFKTFDDAVAWRKDLEMYREKLLLSR